MSLPLVSIVTPSFNGARFLREAMESVLSQDYPHIEHLVVDGGSSDGTLAILESYDESHGGRLRWISEPDRGQSHALNKGFGMAGGEIVAWLNTDDLLLPGAVSAAVEAFQREPQLGMVYGEGLILNEAGGVRCRFPYTEPFDLWRLIHIWDSILQQSVFLRKHALDSVGGVNESLHWGLDWDLFIRVAKRFPVRRLDAELGAIREHGVTKTATGGFQRWRELSRISTRHARRWCTPAALLFGLDTYHKAVTRRFGTQSGGLIGRGLLHAHGRAALWFWPRLHDAQGWFENGWASPRVHLAFPRCEGETWLEIAGSVPESPRKPFCQALQIRANARTIWEQDLPSCRFRLAARLPSDLPQADMLSIELRASSVLGRERSPRGRLRRLCYQLDRVRLKTPQHTFECLPPSVFP
jgi:hypothetical protein